MLAIARPGTQSGFSSGDRFALVRWIFAALTAVSALGLCGRVHAKELTAAQIVEKNVAARGGLDAWRKVETMVWTGHMEGGGIPVPTLPFLLEQKRPNKTHFEIDQRGQRSLRVFDGTQGWKVRPDQSGRPVVQPFTMQEVRFAKEGQGIDGPLIDYQAKGNTVSLGSVTEIDGRKTYRLNVNLPSGELHHVWVDAGTFLDVQYDRTSYTPDGKPVMVTVSCRDYRTFEGLQLPTTIETGGGSGRQPERMVIERVTLNFPLDDEHAFGDPATPHKRNAAHAGVGAAAAYPDSGSNSR
jgi:hypothetical protein